MDKVEKKSLRRHLLAIYVFYFIVLVAGCIHSLVPDITATLFMGNRATTEDTITQEEHGLEQFTYCLMARIVPNDASRLSIIRDTDSVLLAEAELGTINLYVPTNKDTDPEVLRRLENTDYTLFFFLPALLAKLVVLILIAIVINIIRKSIRDEQPLSKRVSIYARTIGLLLIFSEVCVSAGNYMYNHATEFLLQGSGLEVATAFTLDYWNIFMAVLVLFSAEVFSIGIRLSEEQKLTI